MIRIGGFWLIMVRICTGLVCVRSKRRLVAARPRAHVERVVVWRAGCSGGMLSW
jgi:hypothetical protein